MKKRKLKKRFVIFFLLMVGMLHAQKQKTSLLQVSDSIAKDSLVEAHEYLIQEGDSTLSVKSIDLDEVLVVGPYKFSSRDERRTYLILKRKTKKVWPYAVLASERLTVLQERLEKLESGYKKRRYTKMVQRYIEEEFTEELKKLTKTEGQILVKLMYRQTGKTTFDIVKELKSGWRAFWYNTTASLFNISLKETYDPFAVKEDYYIEHILRRAFQKKQLEAHEPEIDFSFVACMQKWN